MESDDFILITPLWPTQSWFPFMQPPTRTPRDTKAAPVVSETKISGVPLIKEYIQTQNVPSTAQDIILASWKKSTLGKYNSILKRWADFCHQRGKENFCTNADEIITFLTTMIENENIGYKTICGYRSALNTVISIPQFPDISKHPLIRRFIKGVFNIKPPVHLHLGR